MGNATRASRGKPHIFLTVENRVGPASRFRDSQSTAQPLRLHFGLGFYSFGLFCNLIRLNSLIIGFLFVVPLPCYVASSIPNITVRDLPFTTLGCRYPRPDFHRLDVRHARRTKKRGTLLFLVGCHVRIPERNSFYILIRLSVELNHPAI